MRQLTEQELLRCGEFVLPGVAKLVVQQREKRMGRNPATGARVETGQAGGQGADREAAQGRGRSVDAVTPHAFITKVAGLSCSIEHGRYPWIPPEIGRPDGRNHTGEGSGVSRGRGRSTSKFGGRPGGRRDDTFDGPPRGAGTPGFGLASLLT